MPSTSLLQERYARAAPGFSNTSLPRIAPIAGADLLPRSRWAPSRRHRHIPACIVGLRSPYSRSGRADFDECEPLSGPGSAQPGISRLSRRLDLDNRSFPILFAQRATPFRWRRLRPLTSTPGFNPWLQPPGFNPWRMEIILIGEMNIGEHRGTSRQDPIEKYRISEGAEAAAPLDPDSNTRGEFHFLRSEFEPSQEHASQRTMRRWGIDPVARSGAPRAPATSTSPTWRPTSRFRTPMSTSIVSDRPRIPSMGSTVTGGP